MWHTEPLLGNDCRIIKCTRQPLLINGFAKRHVYTATKKSCVFCAVLDKILQDLLYSAWTDRGFVYIAYTVIPYNKI